MTSFAGDGPQKSYLGTNISALPVTMSPFLFKVLGYLFQVKHMCMVQSCLQNCDQGVNISPQFWISQGCPAGARDVADTKTANNRFLIADCYVRQGDRPFKGLLKVPIKEFLSGFF